MMAVEASAAARPSPLTWRAGFCRLLFLPQLNYGVAWFKGCRRVADTLSHFAERIRAGRAWDQAIFSELMLFPASPKRPWSGRHSVRTLDILLYPNTCEQSKQCSLVPRHLLTDGAPQAKAISCAAVNYSVVLMRQ